MNCRQLQRLQAGPSGRCPAPVFGRRIASASRRLPPPAATPRLPSGPSSNEEDRPASAIARALLPISFSLSLIFAPMSEANGKKIGEFQASGLLFKDNVELVALDDPDVTGVTVYVSDFKRNIVDKLAKDFFSEPSQASVTCSVTGPVVIKDLKRLGGSDGQEIFAEGKGLNLFKNKTLRVRRIYDQDHGALIYVAYSTRLSTASDEGGPTSGRYRTSLCAVNLPASALAPPVVAEAAAAANN